MHQCGDGGSYQSGNLTSERKKTLDDSVLRSALFGDGAKNADRTVIGRCSSTGGGMFRLQEALLVCSARRDGGEV